MTNPRIQEIKQEILELARTYDQKYRGVYGDWGRALIQNWTGQIIANEYNEFAINESMSHLEVVQKIVEIGNKSPAYLDPETTQKLTFLVEEWSNLLPERERERANWKEKYDPHNRRTFN